MTQALPTRVQAELDAADALMVQDKAAREARPAPASIADLVQPPAPTPVQSAAPQVPAAPLQAPPAPAPAEDFRQKYLTLQGKYNAEVAPLQRESAEQKRHLTEMAAQLKALTEAKAPAATTPQVSEAQDITSFGADLCEMVVRVTSKKIAEAMAALEPRLVQLGGQVSTVTQQAAVSAEQQFYTLLSKLVPDWEQINGTEPWLKWLGVVDDVYGVQRQAGLDDAFGKLDAGRVAKVFTAYKLTIPAAPAPDSMQNQQVPDAAGGSSVPVVDAKPILSQAAVQAFYRDRTRGAYAGREAEADSIEAQIDLAVAEGRVR